MKLLNIGCKGLANVSCNLSGIIELELQDVDMDFLEDVPTSEIAKWHSNKALLEQMDSDEIIDYLESRYDLKMIKNSEV